MQQRLALPIHGEGDRLSRDSNLILTVRTETHFTSASQQRPGLKSTIQRFGDLSLRCTVSVTFNLAKVHQVFCHTSIYMCICRLYTHIYVRYTCTVCIVTYIWFNGSQLFSRGSLKGMSEQQA